MTVHIEHESNNENAGDFVDNAVRENAKRGAAKAATESEIVSHLIHAEKVKVLAARYDLDSGSVEFLT